MIPRILDVTLRDGGYVNGWNFPLSSAAKIVAALGEAGVPFAELGYFRPRLSPSEAGPKCCHPEYLEAMAEISGAPKLLVMVHPRDVDPDDYAPLARRGVWGVRFIVKASVNPDLARHVEAARAAGLACSINLIRLSERRDSDVLEAARAAEAMGADWFYGADSNSSLFPDRVEELYRALSGEVGLELGFHAHDSLRLAFANCLAAWRGGARLLDGSLGAMGKGAGNLSTELILAHLTHHHGAHYRLGDLAAVTDETLAEWIGPDHRQKCENILSALLDLNIDDLAKERKAARENQREFLAELEAGLGQVVA